MAKPAVTASVLEFLDTEGLSPYGRWFDSLPTPAALKIDMAVARLRAGNRSEVKPVGQGVSERRVDFGPGYRIYFAQDGEKIVVLLGGGDKRRQQADIAAAIARWKDYKSRR